MADPGCGVPEERWIDWHLRKLPPETAAAMERHLALCSACRLACRQWGEWLGSQTDGVTASSGGGDRDGVTVHAVPSPRVYRALRRRLRPRAIRRRLRQAGGRRWAGIAASLLVLAAAGLLLYAPGGGRPAPGTKPLEPAAYARQHQPEAEALMGRPDTVLYTLPEGTAQGLDAAGHPAMVRVWLNGSTGEMFLLVEGVLPASSLDVQAWGDARRQLSNLGLLEFHQAQGHLYSQLRDVAELEALALTIEPKGGSLQPTAPESAARIRLAGADGGGR